MAFVVNDKQYEKNSYEVQFSLNSISALKALTLILRRLLVLFYTLDREKSPLYNRLISRIAQKLDTISVILSLSRNIYWLEQSDSIDCRICTLPKQLDSLLYEDVWSIETPSILTSVTMSVNGDFSYLKRKLGIDY